LQDRQRKPVKRQSIYQPFNDQVHKLQPFDNITSRQMQ